MTRGRKKYILVPLVFLLQFNRIQMSPIGMGFLLCWLGDFFFF